MHAIKVALHKTAPHAVFGNSSLSTDIGIDEASELRCSGTQYCTATQYMLAGIKRLPCTQYWLEGSLDYFSSVGSTYAFRARRQIKIGQDVAQLPSASLGHFGCRHVCVTWKLTWKLSCTAGCSCMSMHPPPWLLITWEQISAR